MHSAGRDKQSSAWVGGRTRRRLALAATAIAAFALSAFAAAPFASAESMGPINFEPTAYATGNIDGQNSWMKTGPYDVGVAAVSGFSDAFGLRVRRSGAAHLQCGDQPRLRRPDLLTRAPNSGG